MLLYSSYHDPGIRVDSSVTEGVDIDIGQSLTFPEWHYSSKVNWTSTLNSQALGCLSSSITIWTWLVRITQLAVLLWISDSGRDEFLACKLIVFEMEGRIVWGTLTFSANFQTSQDYLQLYVQMCILYTSEVVIELTFSFNN